MLYYYEDLHPSSVWWAVWNAWTHSFLLVLHLSTFRSQINKHFHFKHFFKFLINGLLPILMGNTYFNTMNWSNQCFHFFLNYYAGWAIFLYLPPIPGIVSAGLIFPFTNICTQYLHQIHPPEPFPHNLPSPWYQPPHMLDMFCPPVLQFCRRKNYIFTYLR
jgi:hypothetical protein